MSCLLLLKKLAPALVVVAAIVVCLSTTVDAQSLNTNLVRNNGAEQGTAYWSGSGGYYNDGISGMVGRYVFYGNDDSYASLTQDIYVGGQRAAISQGAIYVDFNARVGGYRSQDDRAQVQLHYLSSSRSGIASSAGLGPVWPNQRSYSTSVVYRSTYTCALPENTYYIRVTMQFWRSSGWFTDNDGYVDNINVILRGYKPLYGVNKNLIPASGAELSVFSCWWPGAQRTSAAASGKAGSYMYWGGASSSRYSQQWLDVRSDAGSIDNGNRVAVMSAMLGGYASDRDTSQLHVTFHSSKTGGVLGSFTVGPVTNAQRSHQTKLLYRMGQMCKVPRFTRFIKVQMTFVRGTGSNLDAYIDSMDLQITTRLTAPSFAYNRNLLTDSSIDNLAVGCYWPPTSTALLQLKRSNVFLSGRVGSYMLETTFVASNAAQMVDIRSATTAISAGIALMKFTGNIGGWANAQASAMVYFHTTSSTSSVISSQSVASMTATSSKLLGVTGFACAVPTNARYVRLVVSLTPVGTRNAAADFFNLQLMTNTPPTFGLHRNLLRLPGVQQEYFTCWWSGATETNRAYVNPGPGFTYVLQSLVAGTTTITQRVDVSREASFIDKRLRAAEFWGGLGGSLAQTNSAGVRLVFRTASLASLGTAAVAPVTTADRGSVTKLIGRRASPATIPVGTRFIDVEVVLSGVSAYADDLGLQLQERTLTQSLSISETLSVLEPKTASHNITATKTITLTKKLTPSKLPPVTRTMTSTSTQNETTTVSLSLDTIPTGSATPSHGPTVSPSGTLDLTLSVPPTPTKKPTATAAPTETHQPTWTGRPTPTLIPTASNAMTATPARTKTPDLPSPAPPTPVPPTPLPTPAPAASTSASSAAGSASGPRASTSTSGDGSTSVGSSTKGESRSSRASATSHPSRTGSNSKSSGASAPSLPTSGSGSGGSGRRSTDGSASGDSESEKAATPAPPFTPAPRTLTKSTTLRPTATLPLPPPPTPSPPELIPPALASAGGGAAGVAGVAGALAASPAAAAQLGRVVAVLFVAEYCGRGALSTTTELPFLLSPTGLGFGPDEGKYYRGAVLGNIALMAGAALLITTVVTALRVIHMPSAIEAAALVVFPSCLVIVAGVLLTGTTLAGVGAVLSGGSVGVDAAMCLLAVVASAGLLVYAAWFTFVSPSLSATEYVTADSHADPHHRKANVFLRAWRWLWSDLGAWRPKAHQMDRLDVPRLRMHALLYNKYRGKKLQRWLFVDLLATVLVGAFAAVSVKSCVAAAWLVAAVLVATAVGAVALRPYLFRLKNGVFAAICVTAAVAALLVVASVQIGGGNPIPDANEPMLNAAAYLVVLCMLLILVNVILSIAKMISGCQSTQDPRRLNAQFADELEAELRAHGDLLGVRDEVDVADTSAHLAAAQTAESDSSSAVAPKGGRGGGTPKVNLPLAINGDTAPLIGGGRTRPIAGRKFAGRRVTDAFGSSSSSDDGSETVQRRNPIQANANAAAATTGSAAKNEGPPPLPLSEQAASPAGLAGARGGKAASTPIAPPRRATPFDTRGDFSTSSDDALMSSDDDDLGGPATHPKGGSTSTLRGPNGASTGSIPAAATSALSGARASTTAGGAGRGRSDFSDDSEGSESDGIFNGTSSVALSGSRAASAYTQPRGIGAPSAPSVGTGRTAAGPGSAAPPSSAGRSIFGSDSDITDDEDL